LPYYFNKIQKIGTWIKSVSPNTCIIINTNGSNLKVIAYQKWIDKIALSRHHYKPSLNDSLFKCFTADDVDILMFGDKKKINLSCVCQKDILILVKNWKNIFFMHLYKVFLRLMFIH
jgi:hypothetical protein